MLHEYAIEPDALASWDRCRIILDRMGFFHGRAIGAYPNKKQWKRMVREAARVAGCGDREFKRIEEKLQQQHRKFLFTPRSFDDTLEPAGERWVRNAIAQQATPARFHGIIATQAPGDHEDIILDVDVDESHPRLAVPRSARVLREAAPLANYVGTLIRNSSCLLLIDPHFEPHVDRWWPVVKACLAEAASAPAGARVEIHSLDNEKRHDFREFEKRCQRNSIAFLPPGIASVQIVRWRLRVGTPNDFHARYVLTDRGGYRLDKGLDEERGVEQPVELLDDQEWRRVWDAYQDGTAVFDKDGETTVP